jgi:carotenoid 1,2-hydratase
MTERGETQITRDAQSFAIGPSAVHWDGNALTIDINEHAAPIPFPVRGRVRVTPQILGQTAFALDDAGCHSWHPVAPRAHVEASFADPGLNWTGSAYFDSNRGCEPLEDAFVQWQWSRAHLGEEVGVIYEGNRRDGSDFALALRCDSTGYWHDEPLPRAQCLPGTLFGMKRRTRVDAGHSAQLLKTWEDAPFYARSALNTQMFGRAGEGVHESLSLDRFVSPVCQWMLPFRMPRRTGFFGR